MQVCAFLLAFMADERITPPSLPGETLPIPSELPEPYVRFQRAWQITEEEKRKRDAGVVASESAADGGEDNFPPGFEQELEATLDASTPDGSKSRD